MNNQYAENSDGRYQNFDMIPSSLGMSIIGID